VICVLGVWWVGVEKEGFAVCSAECML